MWPPVPISRRCATARLRAGEPGPKLRPRFTNQEPDSRPRTRQTGELSSVTGGKQYETDVAIVGAGGAGMAAGIEALDAGARAVVFERDSELGGSAILSGRGSLLVGAPSA